MINTQIHNKLYVHRINWKNPPIFLIGYQKDFTNRLLFLPTAL